MITRAAAYRSWFQPTTVARMWVNTRTTMFMTGGTALRFLTPGLSLIEFVHVGAGPQRKHPRCRGSWRIVGREHCRQRRSICGIWMGTEMWLRLSMRQRDYRRPIMNTAPSVKSSERPGQWPNSIRSRLEPTYTTGRRITRLRQKPLLRPKRWKIFEQRPMAEPGFEFDRADLLPDKSTRHKCERCRWRWPLGIRATIGI